MQQQERFVKWEPISGLPRALDTPVLTDHYERGFQLTLAEPSANGRAFDVHFENPLAFRSANESYRLKMIESLTDVPWSTFKVENSEWLEWFHDQTLGIYRDWRIQHFVFLGEAVVEVLSVTEPRIAEIERNPNLR
jgi:hypothetical protein